MYGGGDKISVKASYYIWGRVSDHTQQFDILGVKKFSCFDMSADFRAVSKNDTFLVKGFPVGLKTYVSHYSNNCIISEQLFCAKSLTFHFKSLVLADDEVLLSHVKYSGNQRSKSYKCYWFS